MIKGKRLTRDEAMYFRIPKGKILHVVVNWEDEGWKTHDNIFNVVSFETSYLWGKQHLDIVRDNGKIKSFEWNRINNVEYYLSDAENSLGELIGVWNL